MPLLNSVVDTCFELQNKSVSLPTLEKQLEQAQKEIDNVMNAIKAGIITPTTKDTLVKLEEEKETLILSIAKEKIERPVIPKELIKKWLCKFRGIDNEDTEAKQRLINLFINSIYVYDDKMVITFNYKDNDKAVTFDEIKEMLDKKDESLKRENPDNPTRVCDCQGSPLKSVDIKLSIIILREKDKNVENKGIYGTTKFKRVHL